MKPLPNLNISPPQSIDPLVVRLEERDATYRKILTEALVHNGKAFKAAQALEPRLRQRLVAGGVRLGAMEKQTKAMSANRAKELKTLRESMRRSASASRLTIPDYFGARARKAAYFSSGTTLQPQISSVLMPESLPGYGWLGGTDVDAWTNNPDAQQVGGWMKGGGLGWDGVQPFSQYVYWAYLYAPPETRTYQITMHFYFRGNYIVQAFDEWWNSKFAAVSAGAIFLNVWQSADPGGEYDVELGDFEYGYGDGNINMAGSFNLDQVPTVACDLQGGTLAFLTAYAGCYVYARGDDSYAELSFGGSPDQYIACPFMHIT